MSLDISNILRDWPYEPGQVTARRIRGADGKDKIQLRLDLGMLQMDLSGRPDGLRPHGYESYFDYYEEQLAEFRREHGSDRGFSLDERDCELLRTESVMYYHRYLAEFVLEDYPAVIRDSNRNLRVMDFCQAYADDTADRYVLEQYRPYVLMMNSRARAYHALRDHRPKVALAACQRGIRAIEDFYNRFGQKHTLEESSELAILRAMTKEIKGLIPEDPIQKLQQQLDAAVRNEQYEKAAMLRDKIHKARQQHHDEPS